EERADAVAGAGHADRAVLALVGPEDLAEPFQLAAAPDHRHLQPRATGPGATGQPGQPGGQRDRGAGAGRPGQEGPPGDHGTTTRRSSQSGRLRLSVQTRTGTGSAVG